MESAFLFPCRRRSFKKVSLWHGDLEELKQKFYPRFFFKSDDPYMLIYNPAQEMLNLFVFSWYSENLNIMIFTWLRIIQILLTLPRKRNLLQCDFIIGNKTNNKISFFFWQLISLIKVIKLLIIMACSNKMSLKWTFSYTLPFTRRLPNKTVLNCIFSVLAKLYKCNPMYSFSYHVFNFF